MQHPERYRQLLSALTVGFLTIGIYSMIPVPDLSDLKPSKSHADIAAATSAITPERPLRPQQGWGGVNRLPGSDGTGTAQQPGQQAPTVQVARAAAIPLGAAGDVQALGRSLNAVNFGDQHWPALQRLWTRESGWNPNARNRSSGACGIPQALPCSKIPDMSPQGQIEWGLRYIKQRYGNPTNAWNFWLKHHWY